VDHIASLLITRLVFIGVIAQPGLEFQL
jgi:hypothetical protein